MKKSFIICAFAAVCAFAMTACKGNSAEQKPETEVETTDSLSGEAAKTAEVEAMVKDAYNTAFRTLNTPDGDYDALFEDYCTKEFIAVRKKNLEVNANTIGAIDYDLFTQSQDCDENSTFDIRDIGFDGDMAIADIVLNIADGNQTYVQLNIKKEGESWKIDDFIGINGSAKEVMQEENEGKVLE